MSVDTSLIRYQCPVSGCRKLHRSAARSIEHVGEATDSLHEGKSGDTLNTQPDPIEPELFDLSFDLEAAREEVQACAGGKYQVQYSQLSDDIGVPSSLVAYELLHIGVKPMPARSASRVATDWSSLREAYQNAILARCYYPDLNQSEIAQFDETPTTQSNVSRAIRFYGWMVHHPEVDTPLDGLLVENDSDANGNVSVKGAESAAEMLGTVEASADGGAQAQDSGDSETTAAEADVSDTTPTPDTGEAGINRIELTDEQADRVVSALFEVEEYELAEVVFEETR